MRKTTHLSDEPYFYLKVFNDVMDIDDFAILLDFVDFKAILSFSTYRGVSRLYP